MGECSISFPGPISRKTRSHLVIDYLKYILYYRGQFPLPLEQLKQLKKVNDELSCSSNLPSIDGHAIFCDDIDRSNHASIISTKSLSKKKFYETISKFDSFFDELTIILETKKVMEIVLNLGPNLMKPKELYHIALPGNCADEECTVDYSSLQKCRVQFFKYVINSDLWTGLKSDCLLPISVLLLLEPGVPLEEHMEQKHFYSLPKNCTHRLLRFVNECNHSDNSSVTEESVSNTENLSVNVKRSGLWVKLKHDLKGFKSCNEIN